LADRVGRRSLRGREKPKRTDLKIGHYKKENPRPTRKTGAWGTQEARIVERVVLFQVTVK